MYTTLTLTLLSFRASVFHVTVIPLVLHLIQYTTCHSINSKVKCHFVLVSAPLDERVQMAGVSDADYVCTLDEKSLKKAKDELNEDPANRLSSVQKFRELVLQQPHIKCPTGICCHDGFCQTRDPALPHFNLFVQL